MFLILTAGCAPSEEEEEGCGLFDCPDDGDASADSDTPEVETGGDSGDTGSPLCTLSLAPTEIDFGEVAVGESATEVVTVSNVGEVVCEVLSLTTDDEAQPFTLSAIGSVVLKVGTETTFAVLFTPFVPGESRVTALLETNGPTLLDLPLVGVGLGPSIEVEPASSDFGTRWIGCEAEQELTVTNIGNADMVISAISYVTASNDLSLDENAADNGPLPWTVEPGDSRVVNVTYAPMDDYADEGYAIFDSDAGKAQAYQQGTGALYGSNLDVFEVSAGEDRFELTGWPVPETIEVRVDSVTVTTGWTYADVDNVVNFDASAAPEAGSTVEIEYALPGDCGP